MNYDTDQIEGGFVLLSRRLLYSRVWSHNDATLRVAIYLLVCANHKSQYWCGEEVKRGQTIRSLTRISEECNMSRKAVRGSLDRLEQSEFITIDREKRAQQGHKITLCNYERYQSPESYKGTLRAQQGHTEGTPRSTNNNDKNEENEEKRKNTPDEPAWLDFENAWIAYDRKGSKKQSLVQWKKLTEEQRFAAAEGIEPYFEETPDRNFRKDFERYLSHRVFESVLERKASGTLNVPKEKTIWQKLGGE